MKRARLLGHEHHTIDAVAAIAEGAAAITLCRGGARKTYSHTDPNEDAVCFAIGAGGMLAAVADGHHGARGAECAIEWLLSNIAEAWTAAIPPHSDDANWRGAAADSLQQIHRAVILQGESLRVHPAPTTLTLALVRPDQDRILQASVGDSHAFQVSSDGESFSARDLGWATTGKRGCHFLGENYEGGVLEDRQWVIGCEPVGPTTAIVLASDGLSEKRIGVTDPEGAAAGAVAHGVSMDSTLQALETCKHVTESALKAQRENRAGDNMSAAVLWLG